MCPTVASRRMGTKIRSCFARCVDSSLAPITAPDSVPSGVYPLHDFGVAACVGVVLPRCVLVGLAGFLKGHASLSTYGLEVLFDGRRAATRKWVALVSVAAVAASIAASVAAAACVAACTAAACATAAVVCAAAGAVARSAAAGVASCVTAALSLGGFGARCLAALEQRAQLLGGRVRRRSAYVALVHLSVASAARLPIGVPVGTVYGAGAFAATTTELAARHALEAEAARVAHGLMPSERHLNRNHGNVCSGAACQYRREARRICEGV